MISIWFEFVIFTASSVEATGPSEQLESGSPCHWARSEPVALAPSANGGQACIEAGHGSRSFFRIESPTNDITHMSPCPWHWLSSCWQDHILRPSIHFWPVWCARRASDRLEFSCFLWTCWPWYCKLWRCFATAVLSNVPSGECNCESSSIDGDYRARNWSVYWCQMMSVLRMSLQKLGL